MVENSNEFSFSNWFVNNCHASLSGWLFIDTSARPREAVGYKMSIHQTWFYDSLRFNYSNRSVLVHADSFPSISRTFLLYWQHERGKYKSKQIVECRDVRAIMSAPLTKNKRDLRGKFPAKFALWDLHKHLAASTENLSWIYHWKRLRMLSQRSGSKLKAR